MVRAAFVQSFREQLLIPSIGIGDPDAGYAACFRAAENHLLAVGRFTLPEIPNGWVGVGEADDGAVARIYPADLRAAAREFWFEITVEMVSVGALCLELPRHFCIGQFMRA